MIVILAILAAILVPALLGYIDKAKDQQYVLYAKNALTATQSVLTEMYAKGEPAYNIGITDEYYKEVCNLIDDTGLNDAYMLYRVEKINGKPSNPDNTNVRHAYIITTACYAYQKEAGGNYKILFYDGRSWTALETEYKDKKSCNEEIFNKLNSEIPNGFNIGVFSIQ